MSQSVTGSALVSGEGNRIDQSRTVNIYYGLPADQPNPNRPDRNERTLINAVWTEVEDRLRQSLHNAILIRLDMAEQRSQVSRPWDSELRTADQKPKTLAPGTPIAQVFDRRDVGGKLLVLGNPGAGKTTTMLDLAATLVQQANGDPDKPIPVMVNLSSWQNPKQSFADWLLNELKLKYGVSQKLGQTWLAEKKLLPLLDGLDELPPARQEPAVQGINTWLQSETGAPRLLVCSRLEEYELYNRKLDLNGAICLSPLTDGQLNNYLASLKMTHLWETLQHDDDLLALVRTPLLLSVSILANDDLDGAQWSRLQTTQERLDHLLDAYIGRRLHEPVNSKQYPPRKQPTARQTRHWLVWLAKELQNQSESEFLIEKIQPHMLTSQKQKHIYGLIVGLTLGLIFGLSIVLINRLTFREADSPLNEIGIIVILGIVCGFFGGLFRGISEIDEQIYEFGYFNLSRRNWNTLINKLKPFVIFGLFSGLFFGLFGWFNFNEFVWLIYVPIFGLIFGFCLGIFDGLNIFNSEIRVRAKPNQGIWKTARNVLPITLVSCPLAFLLVASGQVVESAYSNPESFTLEWPVNFDWLQVFVGGILLAFVFGGTKSGWLTCLKHLVLRLMLCRNHAIPWNYARFLNHCTDRLLLQRVGGRYRFIHRLIQEHFAAMLLEK